MPQQVPWSAWMTQQAQSLAPRTEADGSTPEEQMASQIPDIPELTPEEAAVGIANGTIDPSAPAKLVTKERIKNSEMTRSRGPLSQSQLAQEMVDKASQQSEAAYNQQKLGIEQLNENLNQMRQLPRGRVDYSPFVSFAKMHDPTLDTQSAMAAAQSLKPESPEQRAEKLLKLQDMLQGHKDASSKMAFANLAAQLKAQGQNSDLATAMKQSTIDKNQAIASSFAKRPEQFDRTISERVHAQTLQSLRNNKNAQQKLMAIQGIDNAGKIIEDAPEVTPQIFHDYQQALVGAIMRGNSGVAERSERYMKSAGIDAATIRQYLTGEPIDIGKNSNLIKAAQGFAKSERHSIKKQYEEVVDAATSGQDRIYKKNPELKKDLVQAVQSFKGMAAESDGTPQIGDEVEGYIYKGGDPKLPESWEQK